LVARAVGLGGDAPVLAQPSVGKRAEDGLGVADVDRQEHAAERNRLSYGSSSELRLSPIFSASASAVRRCSSPSARSSSTVPSPEVQASARGMIRVGRFLSHTQTSSILRWKKG